MKKAEANVKHGMIKGLTVNVIYVRQVILKLNKFVNNVAQ